jgi:hypothetical protein
MSRLGKYKTEQHLGKLRKRRKRKTERESKMPFAGCLVSSEENEIISCSFDERGESGKPERISEIKI